MKKDKRILYENEVDFIKKLKALKRYCPLGYKDLLFNKSKLLENENGFYKTKLRTSKEFETLYGAIKVVYEVKDNVIVLKNLEPEDFLLEGHARSLEIYNGIPFRNNKDKFKIKMMNLIKEK